MTKSKYPPSALQKAHPMSDQKRDALELLYSVHREHYGCKNCDEATVALADTARHFLRNPQELKL